MVEKILTAKPSITEREISYVTDAITNGWGDNCYGYIARFEKTFSEYLGRRHALAMSSCTSAIHVALAALGIKPGDEVIVPDSTWVACATPITFLGAVPVFVDVLPDTWCIDPEDVKRAITKKTRAILAVHLYGSVCEMDELLAVGKTHGIPVIEDAAEALGSEYRGKKTGSMGDIGVFSFHGTKTCSTGEGGMLVCHDSALFKEVATLANQGRDPAADKMFWMSRIGYKTKMSNLQAAMGCAQIERADELVARKREIFSWYQEALQGCNGITLNVEQPYVKNSFWHPTIIFDEALGIDRDQFIAKLGKEGIGSRPFFYPLSSLPMFTRVRENPVSYSLAPRGINLPSYYDLTRVQVNRISATVRELLSK